MRPAVLHPVCGSPSSISAAVVGVLPKVFFE
jgi:hypothetical protein